MTATKSRLTRDVGILLTRLADEGGRGMMEDWDGQCVQDALDAGLVETCCPCHRGDLRLTFVGWDVLGLKGM
jgi:hypothetical protein